MKVKELIEKLNWLPQDVDVCHLWDGEPRTEINLVWLSKGGYVVTSDYDQACYSNDARPLNAPTEEEDYHWYCEKNPNPYNDDIWGIIQSFLSTGTMKEWASYSRLLNTCFCITDFLQ